MKADGRGYGYLESDEIIGDFTFINDQGLLKMFSQNDLSDFIDAVKASGGYVPKALNDKKLTQKQINRLGITYIASRSGLTYDNYFHIGWLMLY